MSNNSWDERRRAQEEEFFKKQNEAALKRIQEREEDKPRISPVSGEPMEQITYMGVVIDRCPSSGGIWLDSGELEQIIDAVHKQEGDDKDGFLDTLLDFVKKK